MQECWAASILVDFESHSKRITPEVASMNKMKVTGIAQRKEWKVICLTISWIVILFADTQAI